jgi:hypothetical protein
MVAAGVTPAYEHPAPAESMSWTGRLLGGLFGAQLAVHVIESVTTRR